MASSYEHVAADAHRAWAHTESRSQAMKAQIRAFQRDVDVLQRELMCTTEAGSQDGPADAGSSSQGVATALSEYEAHRSSGNGDDSHESRSGRRTERATHECTYSDFLKYQPLNFKGTKGVVGLTRWFEKMESVFHISNCIVACTRIAMENIKKVNDYLRGEIKKLEIKLWNLNVKGTDALSYNQHFQELALMCSRIFPEESDEVEKYVSVLLDMIKGSVMASKTKTMQDAIEFAIELMDQKI
ncbi:hypothetical protein Tco_1227112 [Tanacetum coccineum]